MSLRTKLLLVFAVLGLVPLLVVNLLSYRSGLGAVETTLRASTDERAARTTRRIDRALAVQGSRLVGLLKSDSLRDYVRASLAARSGGAGAKVASAAHVPDDVHALFRIYLRNNPGYLRSVTCLDPSGTPLFRASWKEDEQGGDVVFQTTDFLSGEVIYDPHVWEIKNAGALRSHVSEGPSGAVVRLTAPVAEPGDSASVPHRIAAAAVAEVGLEEIIKEDERRPEAKPAGASAGTTTSTSSEIVVALDNATDMVVYDTNGVLSHQPSSSVLPYFKGVAARMRSGAEGFDFYDAPDGDRWLAAFRQVEGLNLSVAASEDYTAAVWPARRSTLVAAGLSVLAALVGLLLLLVIARQEVAAVESVSRGASAIAEGRLGQRVDVRASGEARGLAESFNRMNERLSEVIAREAEERQFQSFLRISAMVSHDLKNAIAGLSMLVTNMERQFHREEFRADAIESLREATEKLKRTVARLSEPARTLSGEYRLKARPTDLVPLVRRVLAAHAEPHRPLYEIDERLPDTLIATVEADRVENVLENLVINALEAMGAKGGRLTVEAGTLEGDMVFLAVTDTGTGMSDEFIKTRLFRPFSTTKTKGIGLGAFTCREIVEAHGGRLEVESKPGAGTRFRVVLPSRLFKSGERHRRPEKAPAASEASRPV